MIYSCSYLKLWISNPKAYLHQQSKQSNQRVSSKNQGIQYRQHVSTDWIQESDPIEVPHIHFEAIAISSSMRRTMQSFKNHWMNQVMYSVFGMLNITSCNPSSSIDSDLKSHLNLACLIMLSSRIQMSSIVSATISWSYFPTLFKFSISTIGQVKVLKARYPLWYIL